MLLSADSQQLVTTAESKESDPQALLTRTPIFAFDPLNDARWQTFAATHPDASAFHQIAWLRSLAQTYGYQPLALTPNVPDEPLTEAVVFCKIDSWITGRRLVSLPFSDHCEPLLSSGSAGAWINEIPRSQRCKYTEIRPLRWRPSVDSSLAPSESYCFHTLDLSPALERIFKNLDKDSIQRRIRRAEREHLSCDVTSSADVLDEVYPLIATTRRRHRSIPQPRAWFRNLLRNFGSDMKIRIARKDGLPVAALFTLAHNKTVIYKYGCSDERFHNFGGMPFLFWHLIQESKGDGRSKIDFGRTDVYNAGLIRFKDQFGTVRQSLTYFRDPKASSEKSVTKTCMPLAEHLFAVLPDSMLSRLGNVLYKHVG